jgi:hypothetical protein
MEYDERPIIVAEKERGKLSGGTGRSVNYSDNQ